MEKDRNEMHANEEMHPEHNIKDADLHVDKDVSGKDMVEEHRDNRRHHQAHGNKRYESYRNHSSADDQPHLDTSW